MAARRSNDTLNGGFSYTYDERYGTIVFDSGDDYLYPAVAGRTLSMAGEIKTP